MGMSNEILVYIILAFSLAANIIAVWLLNIKKEEIVTLKKITKQVGPALIRSVEYQKLMQEFLERDFLEEFNESQKESGPSNKNKE